MRYNYEFKKKCVEMYRQGIIPEVPEGVTRYRFIKYLRNWSLMVDACGFSVLEHKGTLKSWTPEEKLELVSRVTAGESIRSVAISVGILDTLLGQWVRNYKNYGYNGLIPKKKGRKSKNPDMKKVGTRKPPKPNESEYEELIRLRAENELMKAEIEVIKKEIALREEKEAARLKAKKQQSSRNSEKKDTN